MKIYFGVAFLKNNIKLQIILVTISARNVIRMLSEKK